MSLDLENLPIIWINMRIKKKKHICRSNTKLELSYSQNWCALLLSCAFCLKTLEVKKEIFKARVTSCIRGREWKGGGVNVVCKEDLYCYKTTAGVTPYFCVGIKVPQQQPSIFHQYT